MTDKKCIVFVGGLYKDTTEKELQNLFHGVKLAKIRYNRETGESSGYGYVEFTTVEDAQTAICTYDGDLRLGYYKN